MRDRYLPNGFYIYGVVDPNHCVQSCAIPCTAADFDDSDATCWHHYGYLGCNLEPAFYRPGMTHYRNVVCGSRLNPSIISLAHSQTGRAFRISLSNRPRPRHTLILSTYVHVGLHVLTNSLDRACFQKNSSLHIWPEHFSTTFLGFYPQIYNFISKKILMTIFSHQPFLRFS